MKRVSCNNLTNLDSLNNSSSLKLLFSFTGKTQNCRALFLYLAFPGIHQAIEMGKALPGIREKTHIARPRLTLMLRLLLSFCLANIKIKEK